MADKGCPDYSNFKKVSNSTPVELGSFFPVWRLVMLDSLKHKKAPLQQRTLMIIEVWLEFIGNGGIAHLNPTP